MLPYREAGSVEGDAAAESAESSLGSECSRHAPPPLRKALLGPILIAGVLVVGVIVLVDASLAVGLIVAGAALAFMSWAPLRTHGQEVTLHARGVVVSRNGARAVALFDDVNEVWFEIPWLHSNHGAYLRALRLVDFSGKTHRIPVGFDGGAAVANAVLRECSMPLLVEARKALAAGETLTFGQLQLTRSGITVKGDYSAWSEIRFARLEHARVALFRRRPLFSWRTIRLDSIPNPSIFSALVAQNVRDVRREDQLIVELDSAGDAGTASAREGRDPAVRDMIVGAGMFLVGLAITSISYSAGASSYVVAVGPILFGAFRFIQGLMALGSRR